MYEENNINPWKNLPNTVPFILPEDKKLIDSYNLQQRAKSEITLNEIPSPYIGDPKAPIIFLNLNPSFSQDEINSPKSSQFREITRANLLHEFYDYPFYVLDPSLEGTSSGYKWFNQKFGPLMKISGMDNKDLSRKIFLVEYLPYRSKNIGNWKNDILPSQIYAIHLINEAIARQATIVIMRSKKLWFNAVPTLETYPDLHILHSPQNVTVSERNLGTEGFNKIISKLKL